MFPGLLGRRSKAQISYILCRNCQKRFRTQYYKPGKKVVNVIDNSKVIPPLTTPWGVGKMNLAFTTSFIGFFFGYFQAYILSGALQWFLLTGASLSTGAGVTIGWYYGDFQRLKPVKKWKNFKLLGITNLGTWILFFLGWGFGYGMALTHISLRDFARMRKRAMKEEGRLSVYDDEDEANFAQFDKEDDEFYKLINENSLEESEEKD